MGSVSAEQWDTVHFPWQGGLAWMYPHQVPEGGREVLHKNSLTVLHSADTSGSIFPARSLWMITPFSFSFTLRTDKNPFREILNHCCRFNLTDVKVIFILFLVNPQQRDFNGLHQAINHPLLALETGKQERECKAGTKHRPRAGRNTCRN